MTRWYRGLGALVAALALSAPAAAQVNCNVGIDFYPDGGVKGCVLNGHHRIHTVDGSVVVCADGERLEQHPDGRLARCTLREAARLDGAVCPPRSQVRFEVDGRLRECLPPPAN